MMCTLKSEMHADLLHFIIVFHMNHVTTEDKNVSHSSLYSVYYVYLVELCVLNQYSFLF